MQRAESKELQRPRLEGGKVTTAKTFFVFLLICFTFVHFIDCVPQKTVLGLEKDCDLNHLR